MKGNNEQTELRTSEQQQKNFRWAKVPQQTSPKFFGFGY